MSYKISKELFEAVVYPLGERTSFCVEGSVIKVARHNTYLVNDFFFKCKEWAWQNNFCIITQYDGPDSGFVQIEDFHDNLLYEFTSDSEQQATFDACEWILENKDKQ